MLIVPAGFMLNPPHHRQSQSGNVLFIILIAVVLFAALSFAISQTTQHGERGVTQEKYKIDSSYVHQFPTMVREAIKRMIISQAMSPTDLSFAHGGNVAYGIPGTSPAREVFHPQGGAVAYQFPPANINDGSDWVFTGNIEVQGIGTTTGTGSGNELLILLPGIGMELCMKLNEGFGGGQNVVPTTLTVAGENAAFTGTFTYSGTLNHPVLNGKDAFCYYSQNLSKYVFYQVLWER